MKPGDKVFTTSTDGSSYEATVVELLPKRVKLLVENRDDEGNIYKSKIIKKRLDQIEEK